MITASDRVKFIESVFGTGRVYAKNIDVKCPFCDDSKKKRLSIRLSDDVNHCWVCGWGARTLLPLVSKFGSKDQVQEYKTRFLPELPGYGGKVESDEGEKPVAKLPTDFRLLTLQDDAIDPDVKAIQWYVRSRGLSEKDMWRWRLGSSNKGNLRRRVVVPSFDAAGKVNYFVARAIDDKFFGGKYANCDVNKLDVVFNELNIDWKQKLVLVEGPFDLMKCRMNATCLLGSSLSPRSLLFQRIIEHETPVVLMLDDEMQPKSQAIGKLLTSFNVPVSIVKFNGQHDPGEMTFKQVAEYVEAAVPWSWKSFLSYKIATATGCSLKI